jgi:uncharacterized protein YkwD
MKTLQIQHLRKYLFLLLVIFFIGSCKKDDPAPVVKNGVLNTTEAQSAFNYLNLVRVAPSTYSNEIGVDLSYVSATHTLVWNSALATAAQNKALDMANRNYFAHVDPDGNGMNIKIYQAGYVLNSSWITDPKSNNFESISAGYSSGIEHIKGLILDEGIDPPGHRNHLLGIVPFWANCYDIGIGYANSTNTTYKTYCCVLIAKHDF